MILILFSIPFSWMSILVAFQTQFYYMLFFAVLSGWALCQSKYVMGYGFSVLAFLSMTPGAFIFPAFAACLLIEAFRQKSISRQALIHLFLGGAIFVAMVLSRSGLSTTDLATAGSLSDFFISLAAALWWPFNVSNIFGVVAYIPFLVLALKDERVPPVYLVLGFFVLLQILAMAYFRGSGGVPPANRYWEVLLLGFCINVLSAVKIFQLWANRISVGTMLSWFTIMLYGMLMIAIASITVGLPTRLAQNSKADEVITKYLKTNDIAEFSEKSGLEISHPNTERLIQLLSNPAVVSVLPSSLVPENTDRLSPARDMIIIWAPLLMLVGGFFFLFGRFYKLNRNGNSKG